MLRASAPDFLTRRLYAAIITSRITTPLIDAAA